MALQNHYISLIEAARLMGVCTRSVKKIATVNKVRQRRIEGIRGVKYLRADLLRVLAAADVGTGARG
jgi:hypothetical protein